MKVIAINGSPRKNKNTAKLLEKALEGAASKGAEIEIIHLYDLSFKGCISCFACKSKNCAAPGVCLYNDSLTAALKKCLEADVIILGSPIYFWDVTGEMRSFLERLMFPVLTYTEGFKGLLKRKIPIGCIYTMNVSEEFLNDAGYSKIFDHNHAGLERLFGHCEYINAYNTVQFDDYSKVHCEVFDESTKKKWQEAEFPNDEQRAFELGVRLLERM